MKNASNILNFSTPLDPDELNLSVLHPADGRALRYHTDEFAIRWIASLSDTVSHSPEFTAATRLFDSEMLKMHIENVLYRDLMDVSRAYMRRHYLQLRGQASSKPVTCSFELFELVQNHWPDDSIPVVARWSAVPLLRRIARGRNRLRDAMSRAPKAMPLASADHPMVAVELADGADPLKKSDAFWLADKAVQPRHVLFVLERQNKLFINVEKELAQIKKIGAQCVALHRSVSANGKIPVWAPPRMPSWLNEYCASFGSPKSPLDRWLITTLKEFAQTVWRWESFFRHFNVAIYQQFTEFSLDTAPRRAAIDRLGGIEVGKMRSQFFDRSSATFYFQHEVAFVWHDNVQKILKNARTRTRAVVAVGYVWDHLIGSMATEANLLRKRLMKPGVTRILTVYDNGAHLNSHFSEVHLETFYSYLVDLARHRPNVALLVKSKKPEILRRMPEIEASLRQLEAEGRCLVFKERLASIVPTALAADLVVAIPASTAGCEAALAGRNVLMYDPGGSVDHALSGPDKGIMHNDFAQFTRALEAALSGPHHATSNNAFRYINLIDPFRDGGAAHRAAAFIAGYLDARRRGLAKQAALDGAHDCYREACLLHTPSETHSRIR